MRHFALRSVAAMLIAVLSCGVQSAWAHGGGGGHGGGGFGGGGHMGGFGGGHMGGFGGSHMGGFGGSHMGGFGGFSGGHMGGFSGGHHSGFGGIPMGSHIGGFSGSTHHSGLSGSSFNSLHSMGSHHLGGSSLGSHSALGHSALGSSTIHHNPNSFTNRHVGAGTVTQGFRGTHHGTQALTSHVGANAQSLLGHRAGSLGNNATFLNHHHVGSTNLGATNFGGHHGLNNQLGGTGLNSLHHHGNFNGMGNHHHHGNFFFNPFFGFYPFGLGFGFGWPYYGFGYPYGYGYGYGYGTGYFRYNPYCYYGGYGNYGAYGYPVATTAAAPTALASTTAADDAKVFAEKGEADFRAGNYKGAVYAWRHAVVDDPKNGVLLMMLGQGLFASGQFDEAAGATQQAMQLLPEDQWGVVVKNFRELYGKTHDYTTQLRALEKDVKTSGENPATRFLLGFHYGYLGYPSHAIKQLDKTLTLAPQDQMAQRLREIMVGPQPGDQKPDAKPQDAGDDAGGKSANDGQPQDKATAAKQAVDT